MKSVTTPAKQTSYLANTMRPLLPYLNREAAGRILAGYLSSYRNRDDVVVLALPRGGVPVGFEIARALGARFDVLVVRKLGRPGQPELAMGAIAEGGICLRNRRVLAMAPVPDDVFEEVARKEREELERREVAYRGGRPPAPLEGQCVILVDDGLATGSTMRAALQALRLRKPSRIIVAVPVAPLDTTASLEGEADEVVCPAKPREFYGIGQFYEDFSQLTDEEVRGWLARSPLPASSVPLRS